MVDVSNHGYNNIKNLIMDLFGLIFEISSSICKVSVLVLGFHLLSNIKASVSSMIVVDFVRTIVGDYSVCFLLFFSVSRTGKNVLDLLLSRAYLCHLFSVFVVLCFVWLLLTTCIMRFDFVFMQSLASSSCDSNENMQPCFVKFDKHIRFKGAIALR